MSLHHGLTDLREDHKTYFTDMLYFSMVPGILPSQLRFCLWAKLTSKGISQALQIRVFTMIQCFRKALVNKLCKPVQAEELQ